MTVLPPFLVRLSACALIGVSACSLPGCAVVTAVDTVASVAIGTVGLAASAVIGTARIAGSAVGATADAGLPDLFDQPPFLARPAAWVMHRLGLALVPVEPDDPALLAFAGGGPMAGLAWLPALATALLATAAEAVSPFGLDNLLVPAVSAAALALVRVA